MIDVYLQLPLFPSLVATTLDFKGANTLFEGVVNPVVNLAEDNYEIIEGINVIRADFSIVRQGYGVINTQYPYQNYGQFSLYRTAPMPTRLFFDNAANYIDEIINWEVYRHYVGLNPLRPSSVSYNGINQGGLSGGLFDPLNPDYPAYVTGIWDWGFDSHWQISSEVFPEYGNNFTDNDFTYSMTYLVKTFPTVVRLINPNYMDLLKGFAGDNRIVRDNPSIILPTTINFDIQYYSENELEPISNLRTLDLREYNCIATANIPFKLPLINCALGSLYISDVNVKSTFIASSESAGEYPYKYFFSEYLDELFTTWGRSSNSVNTLRILGANNNHWNNRPIPTSDLNFDVTHPMFPVDNQRAYDWHIRPQLNGSYGDLVMDSPRTIETRVMVEQLIKALNALEYQTETPAIIGTGTIDNPQIPATHHLDWYVKNSSIGALLANRITAIWKALGGDKYGTNSIDNTQERVTNLGFLTERIAKVLGIRFDDNGKIDVAKEKSTVRKVIDSSKDIDAEKVGINGYGDDGMAVKRINNRVNNKGQIVSDQCVVVQDIPDLIQEYFEQTSLAIGIQESSAIEIKQGNKVARFRSQLEILMELLNLMSSGNEMTRAALVSSLVTQSQTNELIAGLGLPSVTKTIPIQIGNKVSQVPFKGIAAHRSISQEVATATYNIGIVLGQVL